MVSEQQVKETVRELRQQKQQGRKPSNKANTNNAVEEDNSSTDNINSNSGDDGSVSTDNDIV